MNKISWMICFVLMLMLAATMTVGGALAAFSYAQNSATPGNGTVHTEIGEFVYDHNPSGFTEQMQAVLDVAMTDKTYGLNAPGFSAGMKKALFWGVQFSPRVNFGYVGTMDNSYGDDVYGSTVYENLSVVICVPRLVGDVQTIYMYFVQKSKEQLTAMSPDEVLHNVYRATFVKNETTENDWDLRLLADGTPDIEQGQSPIKEYEGQSDKTKTFGFHNNEEIWQANRQIRSVLKRSDTLLS